MHSITEMQQAQARLGTGIGFAVVLLGVLCLMAPFFSGLAVSTLVAVSVIAAGLTMTVYAFKASKFGKGLLQFLFGGVTALAGLMMFAYPVVGIQSLTMVLIAWFLADGILGVVAGFKGKGEPGWGWVIVSGIASLVLGVLLLMDWPGSGGYAVGMVVGIRLIFSGWSIAMLGMAGDAVAEEVDQGLTEVEKAVEEAVEEAASNEVDAAPSRNSTAGS